MVLLLVNKIFLQICQIINILGYNIPICLLKLFLDLRSFLQFILSVKRNQKIVKKAQLFLLLCGQFLFQNLLSFL